MALLPELRDDPPGIRSIAHLRLKTTNAWHFLDAARPIVSALGANLVKRGLPVGEEIIGESMGMRLNCCGSLNVIIEPGVEVRVERRDGSKALEDDDSTHAVLACIDETLRAYAGVSDVRWLTRQELRAELNATS